MRYLKVFGSGFCVGASDLVPGISGGTVAFIMGIYEELLGSIAKIASRDVQAWKFLISFLLGVFTAFVLLAKGMNYLLHDALFRPLLYSAFMGLVIGSVIFCARLLPKFTFKSLLFLLLGAGIAYVCSGTDFSSHQSEITYDVPLQIREDFSECRNFDPETKRVLGVKRSDLPIMLSKKVISSDATIYQSHDGRPVEVSAVSQVKFFDPWIAVCGALAISAMLLPGISGSYLLNILGMYGLVLGAFVDWVDGIKIGIFDMDSFKVLLSMGLGIGCGAFFFSKSVSILLKRFRNATIACLIGFMIGALKAVWPFWTIEYNLLPGHISEGPVLHVVEPIMPTIFSLEFFFALCCFLFGVLCVLIIEYMGNKHETATSGVCEPG